jgi:hypothetical protein
MVLCAACFPSPCVGRVQAVRMLETTDVMIEFTPPGKAAYRPVLKIKGIVVPITVECFVISHFDQAVWTRRGDRGWSRGKHAAQAATSGDR